MLMRMCCLSNGVRVLVMLRLMTKSRTLKACGQYALCSSRRRGEKRSDPLDAISGLRMSISGSRMQSTSIVLIFIQSILFMSKPRRNTRLPNSCSELNVERIADIVCARKSFSWRYLFIAKAVNASESDVHWQCWSATCASTSAVARILESCAVESNERRNLGRFARTVYVSRLSSPTIRLEGSTTSLSRIRKDRSRHVLDLMPLYVSWARPSNLPSHLSGQLSSRMLNTSSSPRSSLSRNLSSIKRLSMNSPSCIVSKHAQVVQNS